MNRQNILFLALATLIFLGGLGFIFTPLARDVNIYAFLKGNKPIHLQLMIGLASGLLISVVAWKIVSLPYLKSVKSFFQDVISDLKMNDVQILFVSICAGIGEELLFRGAIQPVLGIWITSLVFVAVHGYLNPKNLRITLYGIFMTVSIVYLGYLTEYIGIVSSMTAHTIVDIYLLKKLTSEK